MMHYGIALLLTVSLLPALAGFGAALWLGLDPQALARVLATPGVGLSLASSVWSGVIATAVSLALAHLAVAVAVTGGWRRRLHAFTLPLLAVPHLAIGIGLVLVLAPSGLLLRLFSPWATGFLVPPDWLSVQDPLGLSLIAGLVVKESAFLVLVLSAALAQVPSGELLKQSRALGYGALKGWWIAVVPSLQRQIRLPLAAVLVFGIGNVEMAIPLGPDLPPTFSMLLWRWFTDPDPAMYRQAYSGALVLLVVNLLALAGWALMARLGQSLWQRSAESGQRRRRDSAARAGVVVVTASLWLLGSLALAAVLIRSAAGPWPFPAVLPQGGAFAAWQTMLPVAAGVAGDTLLLALATALAATALVLPAAERAAARPELRRRIGALLFLPLLLPQMTFLFGVQVLLTRLHIDGSAGGVLWSHLIFALPYLWGVLAAARANIDPRYASVARTLGSGRAATWRRVTAPLMLRSLLLALALGFSISIALYLPTLFAGAGRIATAATERAAADGRRRGGGGQSATRSRIRGVARARAAGGVRRRLRHRRRRVPPARRSARMTALALEGIVLRLGPRPLFAPVSLAIPGGTVAAVTGASGAGKSSLLACLSGTLPAAFTAEGRVLLDGEDLAGRAAERRGLGLLFQDALLFPHLSVRGNLLFGLRPGGSRRERARRADAELAAMGLDGFGTRDPATLSGGQRIRVALLRLLLAEPRALLLDEPFAALDEGNRAKVRALVFSEIRRRGIPALLVTHDESDVDAAGGPVVALTPP